ncbi:uncharacterized protein LOC132192933 isoform X2 [Neocloeon triangulifer]|uniref:uncharacterized protein LOC132192933 isoform X2 n=1 Tax=Neocloeon triangulifer TaxID=2078957 RepID=UPI00286EE95A|nr:uncharacterized protein LOC132192933 isoform X2 [Neocloeon triangulifer]
MWSAQTTQVQLQQRRGRNPGARGGRPTRRSLQLSRPNVLHKRRRKEHRENVQVARSSRRRQRRRVWRKKDSARGSQEMGECGGLGRGIRCPADEALACANAYCGMTPKIINRSEINRHDLEEEDEDPELLLQPEVQIDEDHDSPPMEFGNSTNCKVEFNKGDDSAASPQIGTGQSSEEEAPPKEIEMQKLQVMKKLLDVQSKRLKVERKRLKVERMRLQIELQKTENNSGS